MDGVLTAASAIAGLLSLTVQITQVVQRHISDTTKLSHVVSCFLEELICLKKLLSDVQDALLIQPPSPLVTGVVALPPDMVEFQIEMEELCGKLRNVQQHPASRVLKNMAWPFRSDETALCTDMLVRCRQRIQGAVVISGL